MEIKGSHMVVTGANRGIGRAVALMAAEDKAHLHLVCRTVDDALEKEFREAGAASVQIYRCDLSERKNVDSLLAALSEVPVDILFNNAGQLVGGLFEDQSLDDIFKMMQVNLNALIQLSQGVLPGMIKRKRGKVINNSSVSGVMNMPTASTYSASKAAVVAFTQCLQNELKGTGVSTLLLLTPGVETRMFQEIPKKFGKNLDLSFLQKGLIPKQYAQVIREAILEDLDVVKPQGVTGISLKVAQYAPKVFNKMISQKFKRHQ